MPSLLAALKKKYPKKKVTKKKEKKKDLKFIECEDGTKADPNYIYFSYIIDGEYVFTIPGGDMLPKETIEALLELDLDKEP